MKATFHGHVPFHPRRLPFYYGWVVLFAGTAGMLAIVPGSPPGMSAFVDEMMGLLDMSRERFAQAYMLGTVSAGLITPWAGVLVDRWGARRVTVWGMGALAVTLVYMGWSDRLYVALGGGEARPWLAFGLLYVGFFAMRALGGGVIMTACRTMIFRWFVARRGIAASLNGIMLSLGFSSAPVGLNFLALAVGWREAWIVVGAVFGTILLALVWVLFRDSPEACGVALEQPRARRGETSAPVPEVTRDYRAREAAGTLVFWAFGLGLALNAFVGTGIAFHMVSLAGAHGIGREAALALFIPMAGFNIVTSLILGWYSGRMDLRWALMLMLGAQAVALGGALALEPVWGRWLFVAGSGIGWGCFSILINVPWPRFFGRRHLGAINGLLAGAVVVMSALGPWVFGVAEAASGGYRPALLGCLAVTPLLVVLGLGARDPQARANPGADAKRGKF